MRLRRCTPHLSLSRFLPLPHCRAAIRAFTPTRAGPLDGSGWLRSGGVSRTAPRSRCALLSESVGGQTVYTEKRPCEDNGWPRSYRSGSASSLRTDRWVTTAREDGTALHCAQRCPQLRVAFLDPPSASVAVLPARATSPPRDSRGAPERARDQTEVAARRSQTRQTSPARVFC